MNGFSTKATVRLVLATASVFAAIFSLGPQAEAGWWCAPGDWGCSLTQEACERSSKERSCTEYSDVYLLEAKMRRTSSYPPHDRLTLSDSKFPLLAQCEAARKQMARNPMYAAVGMCRSQHAVVAKSVARSANYAKKLAPCRCITTERIWEVVGLMVTNASQMELISHRQVKIDDVSKKEWLKKLAENQEASWRAVDDVGSWDVFLAMGLAEPFVLPNPDAVQPGMDPKTEFEKQREFLAKDYINASSLSDRDIQDLRWAASHGEDPKAGAILSRVLKNMHAVEGTVGREGNTPALAWAERHLTDPRARCIVELLDEWKRKSKADLAKMDALAKRRR